MATPEQMQPPGHAPKPAQDPGKSGMTPESVNQPEPEATAELADRHTAEAHRVDTQYERDPNIEQRPLAHYTHESQTKPWQSAKREPLPKEHKPKTPK